MSALQCLLFSLKLGAKVLSMASETTVNGFLLLPRYFSDFTSHFSPPSSPCPGDIGFLAVPQTCQVFSFSGFSTWNTLSLRYFVPFQYLDPCSNVTLSERSFLTPLL